MAEANERAAGAGRDGSPAPFSLLTDWLAAALLSAFLRL
jgi:hypothetical protein